MVIPNERKSSLLWIYRNPSSHGMGFVVGDKNKYVITCAHCVVGLQGAGVAIWQKPTSVKIKTLTNHLTENKVGEMWITGYEPYLDYAVLSCAPLHNHSLKCSTWCKTKNTGEILSNLEGIPISKEFKPPKNIRFLTHKNVELTATLARSPCQIWSPQVWVHYELEDQSQCVESGTSGTPVFDGNGDVWGFLNSSFERSPNILVVNLKTVLPAWLLKEISPLMFSP